jgi:hypothetical protein
MAFITDLLKNDGLQPLIGCDHSIEWFEAATSAYLVSLSSVTSRPSSGSATPLADDRSRGRVDVR